MSTVRFGYSASSNITFKGIVDSGIEREDWDDMTEDEKNNVFGETLFQLVEIWEEEDEYE